MSENNTTRTGSNCGKQKAKVASAETDREGAQAALRMVNQQKKAVVKHFHVAWWQGPLIGLCMAILAVSHAIPSPYTLPLLGLAGLGIFFILRGYSRQPVLVSGWRQGKTRWLSVGFFIVYLIHYFGSMWLAGEGHPWVVPVTALSIFIIANLYGYVWMRLWRKNMEADDAS